MVVSSCGNMVQPLRRNLVLSAHCSAVLELGGLTIFCCVGLKPFYYFFERVDASGNIKGDSISLFFIRN